MLLKVSIFQDKCTNSEIQLQWKTTRLYLGARDMGYSKQKFEIGVLKIVISDKSIHDFHLFSGDIEDKK